MAMPAQGERDWRSSLVAGSPGRTTASALEALQTDAWRFSFGRTVDPWPRLLPLAWRALSGGAVPFGLMHLVEDDAGLLGEFGPFGCLEPPVFLLLVPQPLDPAGDLVEAVTSGHRPPGIGLQPFRQDAALVPASTAQPGEGPQFLELACAASRDGVMFANQLRAECNSSMAPARAF